MKEVAAAVQALSVNDADAVLVGLVLEESRPSEYNDGPPYLDDALSSWGIDLKAEAKAIGKELDAKKKAKEAKRAKAK